MMSPGILQELSTVFRAVFCGMIIPFVYDLLRILRRVWIHNYFWINVEDFLFWMWTSFWIFSVLYRENDGSFRLYTILAMALGMIGYRRTISELFVKIFSALVGGVLRILIIPFKKFKKYLKIFGKKLKNILKGSIMSRKQDHR